MNSGSSTDRPGGAESNLALPGLFRAVVFDLDGVLVDTEPGWRRAETELMRRHGDEYTDGDAAASLGAPVDAVVARYADRLGLGGKDRVNLHEELMELARAEYSGLVRLRPGAVELLRSLRERVPLGVASNTPRELVVRALDTSGLAGSFDVMVTADDVEHPKPAPDIYLAVCQRLGVEPSAAVALEDSPPGIEAARRAGLTVVAIPQDDSVDTSAADHVVATLHDLMAPRTSEADLNGFDARGGTRRRPRRDFPTARDAG